MATICRSRNSNERCLRGYHGNKVKEIGIDHQDQAEHAYTEFESGTLTGAPNQILVSTHDSNFHLTHTQINRSEFHKIFTYTHLLV